MPGELVYLNYWKRKGLSAPEFGIRRHWWDTGELSDAEEAIYDAVKSSDSVLDVGAGDLRLQKLLIKRGYAGVYHTQDIGNEFPYTYSDLSEVNRRYGSVICTDVIEHLSLEDGLNLVHRLVALVNPGGYVAIQTANANFTRSPLAWDMSHLHAYNAGDLWRYLTAMGLETAAYRVVFGHHPRGFRGWLQERFRAWLAQQLRLDHCQNILLLARVPESRT